MLLKRLWRFSLWLLLLLLLLLLKVRIFDWRARLLGRENGLGSFVR
jgi:hypothetical protein